MQVGIDSLYADGGGDNAESYGARCSRPTSRRPRAGGPALVGSRCCVAENMPHDDDLNVGIAPEHHIVSSPYSTGVDLGRDGVRNTADDIDWKPLLTTLNRHGLPLMFVLLHGDSAKLSYWKHWAGITGGDACWPRTPTASRSPTPSSPSLPAAHRPISGPAMPVWAAARTVHATRSR